MKFRLGACGWVRFLVLILAVSGTSQGDSGEMSPLAGGLQIVVDRGMEAEKAALRDLVNESVDAASACFVDLGFTVDRSQVLHEAVFFVDADSARRQVARHFGVSPDDIPPTFGGTVDGAVLFATSAETYERSFRTLYGDALWSPGEYRKLIVHEIAHRVHAMLSTRLYGSEDGMGPSWFFEGLAIACAGQFPAEQAPDPAPGWDKLAELINRAEAGELEIPFYPRYGWLYRSLAAKADPAWMIRHAGDDDFFAELKTAYRESVRQRQRGH